MAQHNLYYRSQLETKVSLLPEQIDADLESHLLDNLRGKIEGHTIDSGIVLKINRIISFQNGFIEDTNFMATVVYPVVYECFICSPRKDLEIVCVLENIVKGFLIARNGPVIVAVQQNNIDTERFDVNGADNIVHKKTGTVVKKGDYLKVSIININSNLGEKNITTIGKLVNLASKEEIRNYEKDQEMIHNNDEESIEKDFI